MASGRSLLGSYIRHSQWSLLGTIAGLIGAYTLVSIGSALPGARLAPGSSLQGPFFVGEVVFEVALTVTLIVVLYRILGHHLSRPLRDMQALLTLLAELTDAREHTVSDHSRRVARLASMLAQGLGLRGADVEVVEVAALLHDIGKVGVPDYILLKPGPLDPPERSEMMRHAALGATIVRRAGPLRALAPLIAHHHEWWNGGGYPEGLKGSAIPMGARVIAVADAVDTMISGRPYRAARTLREVLAELEQRSGTQFDPEVVAVARASLGARAPTPTLEGSGRHDDTPNVTLAEQARQAVGSRG